MGLGSEKRFRCMKRYLPILTFAAIGTVGLYVIRMNGHQTDCKEPEVRNMLEEVVEPEPNREARLIPMFVPTQREARPVEDDGEKAFYRSQEGLPNTIPEHPPFEYNLRSPKVRYPWKNDLNCSKFAVRFGKAIPFVHLLSFPRSGNSWTRYLTECATGFFTGSVYNSQKLYKLGYLGEYAKPSAGTTLLIKEHVFNKTFDAAQYPAILLIRNPKSAIESFASYRAGKGNLAYKGSKSDFRRLDNFFEKDIAFWERVATIALNGSQSLHVVVYENLKADPINEIRKIMKFLIIPEDPERLACLAKYTEGYVNRGQPEFNPFTAEQIVTMMETVRRVNALVEKRGFPSLPFSG